jgi:hypothetical protein
MKNQVLNYSAFAILTLLWLAFGIALIVNPGILEIVWLAFRGIPLIGQLVVALLTLPVVIGLWIWNTDWPMLLRLILVVGLGLATIFTFFPKKSTAQNNPAPARS